MSAIEGGRALIPVDQLPPAIRLSYLLPRLYDIAGRADQERVLQDHNQAVIREAIVYLPPFAKEIVADLSDTTVLLTLRGKKPRDERRAIEEKVHEVLHDPSQPSGKIGVSPKDIARIVSRVVHPDTMDKVLGEVLPEEVRLNAYEKALRAVDEDDPNQAIESVLRVLPHHLFVRVITLLDKGMTFEQIVISHPEIVPQAEHVRYLAYLYLPKKNHRRFADPSEAEEKAKQMKEYGDYHATSYAFGAVYSLAMETRGFVPEASKASFESLMQFMKDVGGRIGGINEFIYENRRFAYSRVMNIYGERIKEGIRALPILLHEMADSYTTEPFDLNHALKAFNAFNSDVRSLNFTVKRCVEALQEAINPPPVVSDRQKIIPVRGTNIYDKDNNNFNKY